MAEFSLKAFAATVRDKSRAEIIEAAQVAVPGARSPVPSRLIAWLRDGTWPSGLVDDERRLYHVIALNLVARREMDPKILNELL